MNFYNDFPITEVTKEELYDIMIKKHNEGCRMAQICAVAYEGYNEVLYSVSNEYTLESFKIKLPIDEEVRSFSNIFPAANLYENEIKELWGVKVVGMALDYDNSFYLIDEKTPFKKQINVVEKEGK